MPANSITEVANLLAKRDTTAVELVESLLKQILRDERHSNIFTEILDQRALQSAAASDRRRADNQLLGALDGIPIAIKDNLHLDGYKTLAGTRHDFSSSFSQTAAVVANLENAGAIVLARCNMDEGALGASNNNPFNGQCDNPRFPGHTPGGSSGGSAAAVAARFAAAALGTDTMGSVRIPAAYCELWGLKPSYGFISSEGLVPLCPELDSIGPIANCAADLRMMLAAMRTDNTTLEAGYSTGLTTQIQDVRIGVIQQDQTAVDSMVASAFEELLQRLSDGGCQLQNIEVQNWNPAKLRRDGLILTEVRASAALSSPLQDNPEDFSETFKSMMAYGRSVSTERLAECVTRIEALKAATLACFDQVDWLLLPTAPQLAFSVDKEAPANQADFTALANVAECPAVAFPITIPNSKRLASAQLLGKHGTDFQLLEVSDLIAKTLSAQQ